ncbi:MAG TPA: antitoxin family protein [Thermoanaerobaculia bacterium]|jgi:predicted DNA-binding antitoxin AbrB/MazE fold protein
MATKTRKKESVTFRVFEAIFEDGVLKPLQDPGLAEHHRFSVQVRELGAGDPSFGLAAWHEVYEGLSEGDVAEVEAMALDRSRFSREDPE